MISVKEFLNKPRFKMIHQNHYPYIDFTFAFNNHLEFTKRIKFKNYTIKIENKESWKNMEALNKLTIDFYLTLQYLNG